MIAWIVEFKAAWEAQYISVGGATAFVDRAKAEQFAHLTMSADDADCTSEALCMTRDEDTTIVDYNAYGTPSAVVRRITIILD
jgi:hypothetical protein